MQLGSFEEACAKCPLEARLGLAAALDCTPPVLDAREETLLEDMTSVICARELSAPARLRDELEGGLAETFLEILAPESVSMGSNQKLASEPQHGGDALSGILKRP